MMGSFSIWHWLIIGGLVALVFGGGGKISGLMGDAAKGIKAFRDGLKDEGTDKPPEKPAEITPPALRPESVKAQDVRQDDVKTPDVKREEVQT